MKPCAKLLAGAFTLVYCAIFAAGQAVPSSFNEQQIVKTWGWIIAQQKNLAGIEISAPERSGFFKGFTANLKGQPPPYDLQKIFPDVERLAGVRRKKLVLAITRKNESNAKIFFAELKRKTNVFELPGGQYYEILKPGDGPFPKPGQTVKVSYVGRRIDGREFIQIESVDLVLVTNLNVCRGWIDAMQKLNKGGRMKFYVPPPLPENDADRFGVAAGSALVFEIDLLDLKETSAEDLATSLLPPAPDPPPPPPSGFDDLQIMETWGWTVARQTHADQFGLTETELSWLTNGLADGIIGRPASPDLPNIRPAVEKFVADRREKVRLAFQQKQSAAMNAFFSRLKENTNVIEQPDGLRYEIVKSGSGPYPKPGQIVVADYTGHLIDGKVFDRTDNEPLHIKIGLVLPGLNEGLQKINKGGEINLYLPPWLGYGDENTASVLSSVPGGSVLIYQIKLLDIQDAPPGKDGNK